MSNRTSHTPNRIPVDVYSPKKLISSSTHCIWVAKIALFLLPFLLNAQTPALFWNAPATDDENIQRLAVDSEGNMIIGATFEKDFLSLPGAGGTDLALIRLSPTGEVLWRRSFGSGFNDEWSGIVVDSTDNIYAAGSFWLELQIDTVLLTTDKQNIKALFVSKFTPDGDLMWVQKIEGDGLKTAGELTLDDEGRLLMAGYFADTLFIGDQQLVANGRTDLFVARFQPNGQFDWAAGAGYTGETRALSLTALPGGSVALTGFYNDTTQIGNDQLIANTFDRDVFVCLYDTNGQPKWARRAGGVHDDAVTGIRYAPDGRLYVTGYLVGVISLSDDLSIQSQTGNPDFYLLTYDTTGTPVSARAYGGRQFQQTTGMALQDDQIWLSGYYQGDMTIDGQTVDAGSGIGSFMARFGPDLQLQKLYNFPSENNLLINALTFDPTGTLIFGGGYTGNLSIGGQNIASGGRFDLFLGQILQATPMEALLERPVEVSVFPNPAYDRLFIQTEMAYDRLRLIDAQGRIVFESARPLDFLPVSNLQPGMYYLVLTGSGWRRSVPVLIGR
jgi:outer membrane protein assembly factor BamB